MPKKRRWIASSVAVRLFREYVLVMEDNHVSTEAGDPGNPPVRHEPSAGRFAVRLDDRIGYLAYTRRGNTLDFTQVYVPPEHRRRGIAGKITRSALEHARAEGISVVPSCPYVAWYVSRHPEYRDLIPGSG